MVIVRLHTLHHTGVGRLSQLGGLDSNKPIHQLTTMDKHGYLSVLLYAKDVCSFVSVQKI